MKQRLLSALFVILLAPLTLTAADFEFTVGEITYYAMTDSTVTVYDCQTTETLIDIPSTVTYQEVEYAVSAISSYAFYYCESLLEVTVPASIEYIGELPFSSCTVLQTVTVDADNAMYCSEDGILYNKDKTTIHAYPAASPITNFTLPESVTTIHNYAFCTAGLITSITFPEKLESIGDYAFYYCSSLGNVTIPESVTSIGTAAFSACDSFTEFTLPSSITAIPPYMLAYADMTTVNLPETVTSIGNNAFHFCYDLTSINLPEGLTAIGDYAFAYCRSVSDIALPDGIKTIGACAFYECNEMTVANLTESLTTLSDYAFYNCTSITAITVPSGITAIGTGVFDGCSAAETLALPENLTSIGDYAFRGCKKITELNIPEKVSTIGEWAFRLCTGITKIKLPASITSIGDYSFAYCTSLSEVSVDMTTPVAISTYPFYSIASNSTLYVPVDTKASYEVATGWKNFKTIIEDASLSIASVEADKVTTTATAGAICIEGATVGTSIQIFTTKGSLAYKAIAQESRTTISLPTGLYLVAVDNTPTTRVVVK